MKSNKLGYTFYPKDWRSSDSVFELTLQEKGFYRELIDETFIEGSAIIRINKRSFCRKHQINARTFDKLIQKLCDYSLILLRNFDETLLEIPSVYSRLGVIQGASNGGKKSKAMGNQNASKKPTKENIKERETKSKGDFEIFWNEWHKETGRPKQSKEPCKKYWKRLSVKEKENAISKIGEFSKTYEFGSTYFGKARTYLSEKKFNDELLPIQNNKPKRGVEQL